MVAVNNKKISEICLIAPTTHLADRAQKIIEQKKLHINVYTAALDQAAALAKDLMEQGTWLFISRRGTKDYLEQKLKTTVIDIPLMASDYIPALQEAKKQNKNVAFFSSKELSDELNTIFYLLNIHVNHYQFTNTESCKKCVEIAIQEGATLGIGGIVSGKYADELGLPYIVVENSDSSILQSIETAIQVYHLQKENDKKREQLQIKLERFQNILDYTHDAIIAIDEKGRIQVTNRIAEQMLDNSKKPYAGKPIEEVLPNTQLNTVLRTKKAEVDQLMNLGDTIVSTNRVPIMVNGNIKGAVATFRDVKSLQSEERHIRIKLHEKGLTAKYNFSDIIGSSDIISNAIELAKDFADSNFTIMLYGETGTGKEMFAQSIHNASPRHNGPFVAVNCTALSKSLLESELFGYADGSFTGAKRGGSPGLFETAHGGTVFLDEIGELPIEFQAQFLRVLQEKEVRRVGGDYVIPVDVRVIGATNRDLMEEVEAGKFRRDLYYRLNVLNLLIPPLRERQFDFIQIAEEIYAKVATAYSIEDKESFLSIIREYSDYPWPGNVRELNNVVERVCLLQKSGLPKEKISGVLQTMIVPANRTTIEKKEDVSVRTLEEMEIEKIRNVLDKNKGNISQTAKELNISRSTLYRKLKI
jgi:PAS domain S-box-containing protein